MAVKRTARLARDGVEDEAPKASFEAKLTELEEILRQLEEGEKSLDESLELYEKGVSALKVCHQILDRAEKRIRTLVQRPDGEPELRDAADSAEDEAAADAESPAEGKARRRSNDSASRIKADGEEKTKDDRGLLFGGR